MTVSLRVYGPDLTSLLGEVAQPWGVAWSRDRLDVGAGQFTVAHDDPSLQEIAGLLDAENLVVVEVDGADEHAWVIRRRRRSRGDSFDPVEVAGPGAIEVLRSAKVFPVDWPDVLRDQSDTRLFGWMGRGFDDSDWAPMQDSQTGGPLITPGFPDDLSVAYEGMFPGTRALYRRVMEHSPAWAGQVGRMLLAATLNDEVRIFLDGEEVLHKEAGVSGLHYVDLEYPSGETLLAVEVTGSVLRWGMTWVQLLGEDDEGEPEYGQVMRRTYLPSDPLDPDATPWRSYEGDLPYPGVTPGFIVGQLLDEAQGRGWLSAVTAGFDADQDSAGNDWPRVGEWAGAPGEVELAVQTGDDSILDVIERLRDLDVDAELGPDLVLRLWQHRGEDTTVEFGTDQVRDLTIETEDQVLDRLLVRTEGAWFERGQGPREGFLSLGLNPSVEGAARIAEAVVAEFSRPAAQIGWTVNSAQGLAVPTQDFDLGDRISGPWVDPADIAGEWEQRPVRVDTIAAAVDEVGEVDWVIETSDGGGS